MSFGSTPNTMLSDLLKNKDDSDFDVLKSYKTLPTNENNISYPCFHLIKNKDVKSEWYGQWYWIYYAVNGEAIFRSSESYIKRSDCYHSIKIAKVSTDITVFYDR